MDNLLDTNVISQRTKTKPHEGVLRWLHSNQLSSLYLSVISLTEIRFGIEDMDKGRKRDDFERWLRHDLPQMFAGRLLEIDHRIAEEAGRLTALAKKAGAKPELGDALIAATARVHGLQIATLNRKHFEDFGLRLVDF